MSETAEQRLKRLLDVQSGVADDGGIPDYAKVCDVEYGDRVKIAWGGKLDGVEDHGYVMGWPSHEDRDANMAGVIHIPRPDNPGGKGQPAMEWVTLHELRCDPLVKGVWREGP